jgi:AmiR/NasT family two-component response regulator
VNTQLDDAVGRPAGGRSLRVLIVEDETLVGLFVQGALLDLGHTVSGIAPSFRTALAIAAGVPNDLAIVDIGLAGDGGDGIDTAIALRERYGLASVLMTGSPYASIEARVDGAGPLGMLMKPFTEGDVERALEVAARELSQTRALSSIVSNPDLQDK